MRAIRRWHRLRYAAAGSAILALVLQLALLSLHATSAFEQALHASAQGKASAGIHVFCGPDLVGLGGGSTSDNPGDEDDKGRAACPFCKGTPIGYAVASPVFDISCTVSSARDWQHTAFSIATRDAHKRSNPIRGPPLQT